MSTIGAWFYKTKSVDTVTTHDWVDADDLEDVDGALVWDVAFLNQFIHRLNHRLAACYLLNPYGYGMYGFIYPFVQGGSYVVQKASGGMYSNLAKIFIDSVGRVPPGGGYIEPTLTIENNVTQFSESMLKDASGVTGVATELAVIDEYTDDVGSVVDAALFISMRKVLDSLTRIGVTLDDWASKSQATGWTNSGQGVFGFTTHFGDPPTQYTFQNSISNFPVNWGREADGDPFYGYTESQRGFIVGSRVSGGFVSTYHAHPWYKSWTSLAGTFLLQLPYCNAYASAKGYAIVNTTVHSYDQVGNKWVESQEEENILREIGSMAEADFSPTVRQGFSIVAGASLYPLDSLPEKAFAWSTEEYLFFVELNDAAATIPSSSLPIRT
jgi:hypothetical protein